MGVSMNAKEIHDTPWSGTRNPSFRHGLHGTRLYRIWRAMRGRCESVTNAAYSEYGGRGITVCDAWKSVENFYKDMGNPPSGMGIDRINNDGNYEPENCRWATPTQQARNTRATTMVDYHGERLPLREVASGCGVSYTGVRYRIFALGMSVEDALTQPRKTWKTR